MAGLNGRAKVTNVNARANDCHATPPRPPILLIGPPFSSSDGRARAHPTPLVLAAAAVLRVLPPQRQLMCSWRRPSTTGSDGWARPSGGSQLKKNPPPHRVHGFGSRGLSQGGFIAELLLGKLCPAAAQPLGMGGK